jgi:hypothetical protein
MSKHTAKWNERPDKGDFEAALDYLALLMPAAKARRAVTRARRARSIQRTAKDILRASNLPLLPNDESHVAQDIKRIRKGKPLSPIILLQGDLTSDRPFIIADGYHRMCAACHVDEDAPVSAVLVEL